MKLNFKVFFTWKRLERKEKKYLVEIKINIVLPGKVQVIGEKEIVGNQTKDTLQRKRLGLKEK